MQTLITVKTQVNTSIEKAFHYFTDATHVKNWYFADPSWHVKESSNDLKVGGEFHIYMEAKDQSFGFDFYGTYQEIIINQKLKSKLGDGRQLEVTFQSFNSYVIVTETFEAESENSIELQEQGWQAILNQFKVYSESLQ